VNACYAITDTEILHPRAQSDHGSGSFHSRNKRQLPLIEAPALIHVLEVDAGRTDLDYGLPWPSDWFWNVSKFKHIRSAVVADDDR
jgi:hypothetical protein